MANTEADVVKTITSFMQRVGKEVEFDSTTPLYADGIGLDSLETAELSAMLEDELGSDPFSTGDMPGTVGDILTFYGDVTAEA